MNQNLTNPKIIFKCNFYTKKNTKKSSYLDKVLLVKHSLEIKLTTKSLVRSEFSQEMKKNRMI